MMHKFLAPYRDNPSRSLWSDLMPFILVGAMLLILAASLLRLYLSTTRPVIDLHGRHKCYFYVHTGSGFSAVRDSLVKSGYLVHPREFEWLARRKHYTDKIRPGRYLLEDGMRNNALLNMLRAGKQEPLRITIQGVRNAGELAGSLGRRLEVDSAHLMRFFNDPATLNRFGATPATLLMMFVPNTYEFLWNTSGDQLLTRMDNEFKRFWTARRRHKADSLRMTIAQVVTMASIVEKESNKNDEKPVIAGVYINRLKLKIPLQADPTVIYAWNDVTIRRVLKVHTQLKSLYNTYLHTGLPPGPICLPSVASVDAVLHAPSHSYLYFCAKEDLSGSHNFATTLDEHNRNAKRYQKALDKMKIK